MLRRRRSVIMASGGLAVAGVLAACGNPVTANRDFSAVTIYVTVQQQVNGQTARVEAVNEGVALDSKGNQIKGTFFEESCAQVAKTGTKQWRCLTYFAPGGSKLYVAGGLTNDPFGAQQMLDRANSTGTMTVTKVKETAIPSNAHNVPKGAKAYIVKIALRKG
jgi:hypothetical protein